VVLVHEASVAEADGVTLGEFDRTRGELLEEHFAWLAPSAYVPYLSELAEIEQAADQDCDGTVADFAQRAADFIHQNFVYMKGATHVHSSVRDSLSLRAGVCQDFAHVLLGGNAYARAADTVRLGVPGDGHGRGREGSRKK
jgi:transglutaminase-like putative cysteine protease